ncbi:hypothetical protein PHISP_01567 [Aspergillus sp. HF37]|nr:hypothetical protein PHISP_01567 [Aspergillus sp. HF37]
MTPSAFEVGTRGPESAAQGTDETGQNRRREDVGSDYALDIYTAQSIPSADFDACFRLIEQAVANASAYSGMGWSATKKRREMRLPDMRYLILRRGQSGDCGAEVDESARDGRVLGFLSFMVTYEDGKEVNYCYEIHLSPEAQGRGLGRQLMIRYEDIGRRIGLEKAMLTVSKSNAKAMGFYERLGYVVDDFSPEPRTLRNGTVKEPEYLILSKPLKGSASDGA